MSTIRTFVFAAHPRVASEIAAGDPEAFPVVKALLLPSSLGSVAAPPAGVFLLFRQMYNTKGKCHCTTMVSGCGETMFSPGDIF